MISVSADSGFSIANHLVSNEIPGGTVDGTNATFTLASSPSPASSLQLYYRASGTGHDVLWEVTKDYTLSGLTITVVNAPFVGDSLYANYWR